MDLLFLTPYLPSPPRTGATRRLHELISGMARRHRVWVLSLVQPGMDHAESLAAVSAYVDGVDTVVGERAYAPIAMKRRMQARSLASLKSYESLHFTYPSFQTKLDQLAATHDFDAIVVEFATMVNYHLPLQPVRLLDEHNVEYDIHRRTARATQDPRRKLFHTLNYLKLRREEQSAWRSFDGTVFCSERDRHLALASVPAAQTIVVPNGVDSGSFQPIAVEPREPTLLFFGAIDYYPNTHGLLHFLDEIWPTIRRRYPDLKLRIVGQTPPATIRERASESVQVVGFVDDVRREIAAATAVVVPLRIGGGTRLKILEAMSMGKAIVSTSIGAEGIDVRGGEHLLLADEPAEFADAVTVLLEDDGLRLRLGCAARALVEERYQWSVGVEHFDAFMKTLAAQRSVPSGDLVHTAVAARAGIVPDEGTRLGGR